MKVENIENINVLYVGMHFNKQINYLTPHY